MPTYVAESTLVAAKDDSISSDDWPNLTLSAVEVFPASATTYDSTDFTSLLSADVDTPLTIRGKLNSIPRDLSHLRLRPARGTELVELQNVRQFAYGQYDDGSIELWAAGIAGWYSVRPSRAYKGVFDSMNEAIDALYFLADTFRAEVEGTRSRKGKKREVRVTAAEAFAKYAMQNGLSGEDQARAVIERHASFLAKSMMARKEGVDWQSTDIWRWMKDSFPKLFLPAGKQKKRSNEVAKRSLAGKKRKRSSVPPAAEFARDGSSDIPDSVPSRRRSAASVLRMPETPRMESSDPSDSDMSVRRRRGGKGHSSLRPKPSKLPASTLDMQDDEVSMDIDRNDSPSLDSVAVDVPLHGSRVQGRPMIVSRLDVLAGASVDEGIDMSLDRAEDDDSDEDVLIQPLESMGKDAMPVRLRAEHLAPTNEGDTWLCPLDGCMHKVYAASNPASQKLIKEHYRMHVNDEDAEARIELVRKMQAPGLPVNRLMSRIQKFAGQAGFPPPIARRF